MLVAYRQRLTDVALDSLNPDRQQLGITVPTHLSDPSALRIITSLSQLKAAMTETISFQHRNVPSTFTAITATFIAVTDDSRNQIA